MSWPYLLIAVVTILLVLVLVAVWTARNPIPEPDSDVFDDFGGPVEYANAKLTELKTSGGWGPDRALQPCAVYDTGLEVSYRLQNVEPNQGIPICLRWEHEVYAQRTERTCESQSCLCEDTGELSSEGQTEERWVPCQGLNDCAGTLAVLAANFKYPSGGVCLNQEAVLQDCSRDDRDLWLSVETQQEAFARIRNLQGLCMVPAEESETSEVVFGPCLVNQGFNWMLVPSRKYIANNETEFLPQQIVYWNKDINTIPSILQLAQDSPPVLTREGSRLILGEFALKYDRAKSLQLAYLPVYAKLYNSPVVDFPGLDRPVQPFYDTDTFITLPLP